MQVLTYTVFRERILNKLAMRLDEHEYDDIIYEAYLVGWPDHQTATFIKRWIE